ncbi:MAG: inositol monophosphatase, partial [Planctomycetota bacterium]
GLPAVAYPDSPDLKILCAAASRCQALRRTGSAALNLAYTAAGRFDVSWAMSTKIWDIAAGVLLIQEAGGVVTGPEGETIDIAQGGYLAAANPTLMAELQQLVREAQAT